MCAREGAWERVCAVPARLTSPQSAPSAREHKQRAAGARRAREGRAPECAGCTAAAAAAAAPTLPFKSVSKPITADLPRDVLPSVSRSELPEDSPHSDCRASCRPSPPQGLRHRNFERSSGQSGRPHGATLGAGVGSFARPGGWQSGWRTRLGRRRAPLGPARRGAREAGGGALSAAAGKGAPFASRDPSGRALRGAGQEMAARQR